MYNVILMKFRFFSIHINTYLIKYKRYQYIIIKHDFLT